MTSETSCSSFHISHSQFHLFSSHFAILFPVIDVIMSRTVPQYDHLSTSFWRLECFPQVPCVFSELLVILFILFLGMKKMTKRFVSF